MAYQFVGAGFVKVGTAAVAASATQRASADLDIPAVYMVSVVLDLH